MGKIKALWNKFKQQLTTGNKWILWWVVGSILAMLVIHALFVPVGPDWLQARWGAGDLLTYVGTVSLSLLAVWQNKRFKEENDKAQERLERISQQANELSIINKILEHEENRIKIVKNAIKMFDNYSDLTNIIAHQTDSIRGGNLLADMARWRKELQDSFGDVIAELVNEPFIDTNELRYQIGRCYGQADFVIDMLMHGAPHGSRRNFEETCEELKCRKLRLLELTKAYTAAVDKTYRHILYDNVSIQEIRSMKVNQIREDAEAQCKEQPSEKI